MSRIFLERFRRAGSVLVVLSAIGLLVAQSPPGLDSALIGLRSPDPDTRAEAFDHLLSLAPGKGASTPLIVRSLEGRYPGQAERIRTALIDALNSDSDYVENLAKNGGQMTAEFSDYWPDLIWVVGGFRDPRAMKGLLAAVDTGGIAESALADMCRSAVDALIARSQPGSGYPVRQRAAAVEVLGRCMARRQMMAVRQQDVAKIRTAALGALGDEEPSVRVAATAVLSSFRGDPEVRAKLAAVAATDPYQEGSEAFRAHPGQLTVRAAARSVLQAPDNDDGYYFVMRNADTRECRIQKGSERPAGDRYIGPEVSNTGEARHLLCTHLDPDKVNPDLCWSVTPADYCQ